MTKNFTVTKSLVAISKYWSQTLRPLDTPRDDELQVKYVGSYLICEHKLLSLNKSPSTLLIYALQKLFKTRAEDNHLSIKCHLMVTFGTCCPVLGSEMSNIPLDSIPYLVLISGLNHKP